MGGLIVDMLLLFVSWTHVLLAPYTKVEESFNLHSAHDVLMYGVSPESLYNVSLCNSEILCTTHVLLSYPGSFPTFVISSMIIMASQALFLAPSQGVSCSRGSQRHLYMLALLWA